MKESKAVANFSELKKDIKSGEFRKCYLLFGSERYLRNHYEKMLLKAMGGSRDDMNTSFFDTNPVNVPAIIDQAETMPFFADRRIMVIRYSGLFEKNGEALADYIDKSPETTSFIFVEDKADGRTKLYKQISKNGLCVEIGTQSISYLLQNIGAFLKKFEMRISESDARYLLDVIGSDMGNLMSELEKLVAYARGRDVITREDIDIVCCKDHQDRIFGMINAIMDKDIKTCLKEYEDLIALKIDPVKIIPMLEKQLLWMMQLKGMRLKGDSDRTIIEKIAYKKETDPETGEVKKSRGEIGEWQVGIYLKQATQMHMDELQRALAECAASDESIKSGKMNARVAAESLMVKLCS